MKQKGRRKFSTRREIVGSVSADTGKLQTCLVHFNRKTSCGENTPLLAADTRFPKIHIIF